MAKAYNSIIDTWLGFGKTLDTLRKMPLGTVTGAEVSNTTLALLNKTMDWAELNDALMGTTDKLVDTVVLGLDKIEAEGSGSNASGKNLLQTGDKLRRQLEAEFSGFEEE